MTNIVKHSAAKKVKISLSLDEKGLGMRITDDGVGFNPENIKFFGGKKYEI